VDPGPIMELATRYWESRCFLTANDLGLFDVLAEGPKSADEVASALGLAHRPTRLLLNACVGLGLLEPCKDGFGNVPSSQFFLVRGSPAYLGNAIRYGSDMWEAWTRLPEALCTGVPPLELESYTGKDPERTRHFVLGMHGRAMGIGAALVPLVDLSGRRRLLDVGGGPGTYSALFARAHPELRATVLDLPPVVDMAEEILSGLGVGDRVETLAGDYRETPFPGGNDAVLISGVFHRESEQTCRELISRARDALVTGGLLIVSDVFTDAGGATPVFAALFGLNMMLSAPEGGVHADADVAAWMQECRFQRIERRSFPPPMPHRIVLGTR
jgi:SAM-dependent methyltransferase